ncbi:MAG: hypothetical protein DRQ78_05180 [Epsilonproteobacteria bacterium]|nr:MAG: hypothetical protein DRQ78_05180 [Campylobacterota bacterium]
MRDLLLFGPFLWLRKILLYLLVLLGVLAVFIYFVANSPLVIKKVADTFAPDYNISYSSIHGNMLTGVQIEDLAWRQLPLIEHIELRWNPNGLAKKTIIINKLEVEKVDVDNIKILIAAFTNEETSQSENNESQTTFDFSISLKHFKLSLKPFIEQNITIASLDLELDDLLYKTQSVNLENLRLKLDTNVSTLTSETSLDTGKLEVQGLELKVQEALFDIESLVAQRANVDLNLSTNLSSVYYKGKVKENSINGEARIVPLDALFSHYKLPLRRKAISEILIDVSASKERVVAVLNLEIQALLKAEKNAFNLDVDSLHSRLVYDIKQGSMQADTKVLLSTPYAKDILVTNLFTMDDKISYGGDIKIKQFIGVDAKFVKALNNLQVNYEGNLTSLSSSIMADNLEGMVILPDFKQAQVHLATKEAIEIKHFVALPAELNQTKVNVTIDAPISFEENASLEAFAKIRSSLANIDANITYNGYLEVKAETQIPKDSLLRPYSKELKWDRLNPLIIQAKLKNDDANINLKAASLNLKAHYNLSNTKLEGTLSLGSLHADILGASEEKIALNMKIASMSSFLTSVDNIYTLGEIPKIKGSMDTSLVITELKTLDLSLKSPHIAYEADKTTTHVVDDMSLTLSMDEGKIVLKNYKLIIAKQKLFSTKVSSIFMKQDSIHISPLWLNDQLKVEGQYNLKSKKGKITAKANKLHIAHEMIDLDNNINIDTVLDANKTSVKGKIILLGGNIHYDLSQKTFASDSDIVIVQDIKDEKPSPFMEQLSIDLQIDSKKPLVYKKDAINIKAKVGLGIHKSEYADLLVLGSVEVLKGGTYIFENKKFVLDTSFIYFTGDPSKPILDMHVNYSSLNHFITIDVTGSATSPNISFSSKPALSKEQILSVILFDSEAGAGTNSGDDMMRMMGGVMAKSALSNMGVKLDHLVIGDGNSIEVGKKLSDKVTIIYVNDEVSGVKLKYGHSPRTESVLEANDESQSYDIVYKRDF